MVGTKAQSVAKLDKPKGSLEQPKDSKQIVKNLEEPKGSKQIVVDEEEEQEEVVGPISPEGNAESKVEGAVEEITLTVPKSVKSPEAVGAVEEIKLTVPKSVKPSEASIAKHHHHHNYQGDSSSGSDDHEELESEFEGSEEEDEEEDESEEDEESEEEESEETDDEAAEEAIEDELLRKQMEEEAIREMKRDLIDRYILAKGLLKYERKRKSYFEDRIYRTSVRKGLIKEEIGAEEEEESSAKDKKKKDRRRSSARGGKAGKKKRKHSKHHKKERKSKVSTGSADGDAKEHANSHDDIKRGKGFGEAFANKMKYQKLIKKIMKTQKQQANYLVQHQVNLQMIDDKRVEWKKINEVNMSRLMNALISESDHAIDSRSGKRIPHEETQGFCEEVSRIHKSLCETMVKMFRNRRGLELSLRRLEETEIQGEGLQMLEYEQLRSENGTLKDRLEDRVKDVENIKSKISHAIQILAHFRHKMFSMNRQISDGQEKLSVVNTDVYASRAKTEGIIQKYEKIRKEEQALVVDSGLLDNAILLRDYERTHFDVMSLKEEKRNLLRQLEEGSREVQSIRAKMLALREKYPLIFTQKAELLMVQRNALKNRLAMFETGAAKAWCK